MRDPARVQAAIEILDAVIDAAREGGAAADTLAQRYFASRRYAGSKDRARIREMLFDAIRHSAELPPSGRALMLGMAEEAQPDLLALFDGSPHAPAPPAAGEHRATASLYPQWLQSELRGRFGDALLPELAALSARAPLDIRVNPMRADPAQVAADLGAAPIPGLPHALRLPAPIPLDSHPLMQSGAIEVQDAGSQRVVALADASPGETVIDLCAGAGGKTLALAAAMRGEGRLIATDTDRRRLHAMAPRLGRAGLGGFVESRLLNPGQEQAALADLQHKADLVLVDAPCSGTGTWRRNPELRWRLTPAGLARLHAVQARLIALGASLVKPGGRLVYAVCSVLPSEGEEQARKAAAACGLQADAMQAMSPLADGCDGFFVARLVANC